MRILQDLSSSISTAWLSPHQCHNFFIFNALQFYIYPPTIQISASHLSATLLFLYLDKPLLVILEAVRDRERQRNWCCHCEGDQPMCQWVVFKFFIFINVFSLLLGVAEFLGFVWWLWWAYFDNYDGNTLMFKD